MTEFAIAWQEQLPGCCLAILVADAWRKSQLILLARERGMLGFRDADQSGAFTKSGGGGRPKIGATPLRLNALDGGNYFRNLYSLLLDRDIGRIEFGAWLACTEEPPALTLQHLEKWLDRTKASVAVWSHRVTGACVLGPADNKTSLRPPTVHVGVREGHVYRLVLDGPWSDRVRIFPRRGHRAQRSNLSQVPSYRREC